MEDEQIRTYTKKRGSIKSRVTIFDKYLNNILTTSQSRSLENKELTSLKLRLHNFKLLLGEFEEIQSSIECTMDSNSDEQFEERMQFEDKYYSLVSDADILLSKHNLNVKNVETCSGHSGSSTLTEKLQDVKLPTIPLPTFDGQYESWLEFRDTFQSLINSNSSISDIQKFHYLRASLKGDAAQEIIKSLEFTDATYKIAWVTLCERFNNTRLLVHNHVKSLFNIEPIKRESSCEIRKLIDSFSKHLRSLASLGQSTHEWDTLIIYILGTKLDETTAREWEKHKVGSNLPTLGQLKQFLKDRADFLETFEGNASQVNQKSKDKVSYSKTFTTVNTNCPICREGHPLYVCSKFQKLPVQNRIERIKELKLCINCLKSGHIGKDCKSGSCKKCNAKHNTLLHIESKTNETKTDKSVSLSSSDFQKNVLLSTVSIFALDKFNTPHQIRAILDSGSQSSFITASCRRRLKLDTSKSELTVIGLNRVKSNIECKTEVTIQSTNNNYQKRISCYVIPEITGNIPSFKFDKSVLNIPKNIQLADPNFHTPNKIDMLIGADYFWNLTCVGQINLGANNPILQKTRFGWIVAGPMQLPGASTITCNFAQLSDEMLHGQLVKFWEMEECTSTKLWSHEEQLCENHFVDHTKRMADGRFMVSIPLKNSPDLLGNSREQAQKRFLSLERKLSSNSDLKQRYLEFMSEYETLGHMSLVEENHSITSNYLPHHGVLREESLTTKLRVVFDASFRSDSGYSLNNIQMIGPVIQNDLFSLLLRFRKHSYVISADIAKMYRQVLIEPAQRNLQRILWRSDPSLPIRTYELNTVTYGTSAASFLAIRCVHQLALECENDIPDISNVIKNDFYVDDLLTGAESIDETIRIGKEVSSVLSRGCFELRKWISNEPSITRRINNSENSHSFREFSSDLCSKTLGLVWSCQSDTLMYNINFERADSSITKRHILSKISQIFDPLGLLSPCTVIAKTILQELWMEKLSWDESLPSNIHSKWLRLYDSLRVLNTLSIPRQVVCKGYQKIELHGFCDACESAYGACIYLRSCNRQGEVHVRLLCSKTKVAPLKSLTMPRLELCGALVLARLANKVSESLNIKFDNVTYWCDSTVVLGWITTQPNLLKIFVGNRVAEIQRITNIEAWRHVPTADNPADLLSRGVNPSALLNSTIWWTGPKWLEKDENKWPRLQTKPTKLPDLRQNVHSFVTTSENASFFFERFSNLDRLIRCVAYCFRFKSNCLTTKQERNFNALTYKELRFSLFTLIKVSQSDSFPDFDDFCKRFQNLNPFVHSDNTIRVGGRLDNSTFCFNKKHPIIISARHRLTKLLFEREHRYLLHAGPQHLLASIRETYWPIGGRNLARKVVKNCITCFRVKPTCVNPIMGNLPKDRLELSFPFNITGVDYAGPFQLKDRKGRGCKISKCYVSLFICFAIKAVHLELVTDLTSAHFIMALRRFIARRGKPSCLYSDNGTNFVGANSELKELSRFLSQQENSIIEQSANEGVEWKFIPPHSPHFGGLWEAGVRSTKHHLRRVVGNSILTFEEFYTVLAQVEAILNSRPLSPLSSHPSDFSPLTPAHFLVGRALTSLPDPDLTDTSENRLRTHQKLQQLQQHFWKRWSKEYIHELQQRSKWTKNKGVIKEGVLVLIKDDNLPPMNWHLGRIIQTHPGSDGITRVVTIQTAKGVIKRAVSKICSLPIEDSQC